MKKKILLLLSCTLLTSCSFISNSSSSENNSSNSSTSSSNNSSTNSSSSSNNSSISSSSLSSSSSSSSSSKEDLKDILTLKEPNFETPLRVSKDDVVIGDLFNLGNTVDIKISISDVELNKLQDDYNTGYKNETYHVADKVEITLKNGDNIFSWSFDNVGIRQKGNTSRTNILNNDNSINTKNHFKLSFNETFDDKEMYSEEFIQEMKNKMNGEDYSSRDFLGLSGLDMKWNKNDDSTHIKEAYASYLYHASGLITQKVGLTTMSFIREDENNKEYSFGICSLYEPAKKKLIKDALSSDVSYLNMPTWKQEKKGTYGVSGENYGDLYKCSYGVGEGRNNDGANLSLDSINNKKIGIGNLSGSYIPTYERKTNTSSTYEDTLLKNMVNIVNNSNYEDISNVIDLEYFAKEEAITYLIGNPDAFRYNSNNYMIYIRRVDGKAIIIPIDNDRCFGITKDMNFEDGNTKSEIFSKSTNQGNINNKLFTKTILSSENNSSKEIYLEMIKVLKDSFWVKEETFNKYLKMASDSYSDYDFNTNNQNMTFSNYMNEKLKTINKYFSSSTEDDAVYDNIYIVGNFNSWGGYDSSELSSYKLNLISDNTYRVTIQIKNSLDNDKLQFKFNAGFNNYNDLDWTLDSSLTILKKEKDSNCILENVHSGDIIEITINTKTCQASVIRK